MRLQTYGYTYVFYEASLPMSTRGLVCTSLLTEDAPEQVREPQLRLREQRGDNLPCRLQKSCIFPSV